MKLFRTAKDDFSFLGIASNQSRCNGKSAITIIIFGSSITLGVTFLLLEAPTFLEFTINIYVTAVLTVCCGAFTTILCEKKKLFGLINDVEKFIDKSECISIAIQKLSKYKKIMKSETKYFRTHVNRIVKLFYFSYWRFNSRIQKSKIKSHLRRQHPIRRKME